LGPSHVELIALTKQNFTASKLWELADPSAGSHVLKPMDENEERASQQQTIEADVAIRKANEQKLKQQTEEKKQRIESTAVGSSNAPTEKLVVVTVVNPEKIRSSVSTLLERNTEKGWVLLRYSGPNQISLQGVGFGGVSELVAQLEDNQIQYGLIRLPPDPLQKDIFMQWVGPKVSKIEQGKKSEHLADLKKLLGPAHAELTALTKKNFNEAKVRELSDPSSGTHILKDG